MNHTFLSFTICSEVYAVNVVKVLEVLEKQQITRVPNAPHYIKGILNFRGDVVPVFESRAKFNLPERDANDSFVIIVLDFSHESETFRLGAIVDRVRDVITIDETEIKPVPPMSKEFNTEFLQGIFKLKDQFVMLLNVEKVFTGNELDQLKASIDTSETIAN